MAKRKNDFIPRNKSSSGRPSWFKSINGNTGDLRYFPHCKLGEFLVPHVIGSDSGCIMIYPVDGNTAIDEAAFILENAKEVLSRDEPDAGIETTLLLPRGISVDKSPYERRNIHCFSERQLIRFAKGYFSESNEFLRLGKSEFSLGKYDTAFKLLMVADVDNDADAQFMIGQMYAKGKGVKKDKKKAEEWYWKAANQGHAVAALELEKGINREKAYWERKEQELIDEIEEFTNKLLEEDA